MAQKVHSDLNPATDLRDKTHISGERLLASGDAQENLIPGFDNFSVTCEMLEGAKTARGESLGDVYWNPTLGFHTDTHAFQLVGDERRPQHNQVDRVQQVKRTHGASLVLDADGDPITNIDLVLTAYPLEKKLEFLRQDEAKRLADEAATQDTRVPGAVNPKGMSEEERLDYYEQQRANNDTYHSPTFGRRIQEVYDSKSRDPHEAQILVRMDEIIARRQGARHTEMIDIRREAEAEVRYMNERRRNGGRSPRPLYAIKAEFAPDARDVLRAQRAGERRPGRTTTQVR